eukprot:jgi/Chlat1/6884/Chrsp51S06553
MLGGGGEAAAVATAVAAASSVLPVSYLSSANLSAGVQPKQLRGFRPPNLLTLRPRRQLQRQRQLQLQLQLQRQCQLQLRQCRAQASGAAVSQNTTNKKQAAGVNKQILAASSVQQVLRLYETSIETNAAFSESNTCTLLFRVGQLALQRRLPHPQRLALTRNDTLQNAVAQFKERLHSCNARGIAAAAWGLSHLTTAFARMQHQHEALFTAIASRAAAFPQVNIQDSALLLWAFAALNHCSEELCEASDNWLTNIKPSSGHNLQQHASTADRRALAQLAWAFAACGMVHRPGFRVIMEAIDAYPWDASRHTKQLTQIQQCSMVLQHEHSHLGIGFKQPVKALAESVWLEEKSRLRHPSAAHREVAYALRGMGKLHKLEYDCGPYTLDIALPDERIGIEMDGPSHFARNTGLPLGHTELKRRLLTAAGWRVVGIPLEEWNTLTGLRNQQDYLRKRLGMESPPW